MSPSSVARLPSLRRRRPSSLVLTSNALPGARQTLRSPRFHEDFNAPFRECIATVSESTIQSHSTSTSVVTSIATSPTTSSRIRRAFNGTFLRPRSGDMSGEISPVSPELPKRSPIADRFKEWARSPMKKPRPQSAEYTHERRSNTSFESRIPNPRTPRDRSSLVDGELSMHKDRRKEPELSSGGTPEAWWKGGALATAGIEA